VVLTRASPNNSHVGAKRSVPPRWFGVVDAAVVARLAPARQSVLAGLMELPIAVLAEQIAAGEPLVVAVGASAAEVDRRSAEVRETTGLAPVRVGGTGCAPWLMAAATLSWVPLSLALGWLAGGGFGALTALAPWAILGWLAYRMRDSRQRLTAARRAEARSRDARGSPIPAVQTLRRRIAQLRLRLGRADLPDAASTDLRGAIDEIERRTLLSEKVLTSTDEAKIRSELAKLDEPSNANPTSGDPARTARIRDDLRAAMDHADQAFADLVRTEAALDELDAWLTRAETTLTGPEVRTGDPIGRLTRQLGFARDSMAEPERPRPTRPPTSEGR
jgi:hypothetical protein